MSNIFFTSDNHFFHRNIKKFCPNTRFGETVEEMNQLMVEKWNTQVTSRDTVYCLGDFSFGSTEDTCGILSQLNGNIHLITGNHDLWYKNTPDVNKHLRSCQSYKELKIDKIVVVLFHYPIHSWNKMHYGSFHLYGHVHGSFTAPGKSMDVGIDARPQCDMGLFMWDEIMVQLKDREILGHHDKNPL